MSGTQRVVFEVAGDKQGRYDWVRRTLVKFDYSGCGKADRGVLISYLMKVSSYSRAQVKRLIKRYRETGRLTPRQRTVRGFTLYKGGYPPAGGHGRTPQYAQRLPEEDLRLLFRPGLSCAKATGLCKTGSKFASI